MKPFCMMSVFLMTLKVRVGYGVTGNNNFCRSIHSHVLLQFNVLYNGTWITSYGPARNVNNDLHWEKKAELNIGLDYAFLNNRLLESSIYIKEEFPECYTISVYLILPPFTRKRP